MLRNIPSRSFNSFCANHFNSLCIGTIVVSFIVALVVVCFSTFCWGYCITTWGAYYGKEITIGLGYVLIGLACWFPPITAMGIFGAIATYIIMLFA